MPKKIKNVFIENLTFQKLLEAHYRAKKQKAKKKEVILFEMNFILSNNTYKEIEKNLISQIEGKENQ